MFDAFKQAGALAGIMKELPKLQARAKEITDMLEAARVVGDRRALPFITRNFDNIFV